MCGEAALTDPTRGPGGQFINRCTEALSHKACLGKTTQEDTLNVSYGFV